MRVFTFVHFFQKEMIKRLLCCIFIPGALWAQENNTVRLNVAGTALKIYSVQYERKLSSNLAFNNTFFFRPKSAIPFGNFIDNMAKEHGVGLTGIKFDHIFMDEAEIGVKGYSPELRYYFGEKRHRTFVGVFGMYENFDMKVPAEIGVMKENRYFEVKLPINFTFRTLSGGILIGRQFTWNRVGLDLVFIGPHIGSAHKFYAFGQNSHLLGLTEDEKQFVKDRIRERFGLKDKYFSMELNENTAEIKSIRPVPYLGIRGIGVNLSYRF